MSLYITTPPPISQPNDKRNRTAIYGSPMNALSPLVFDYVFPRIELPEFSHGAVDCPSLDVEGESRWHEDMKKDDALGSCLTLPLKLQVIKYCDELTDLAKIVGSVNTTYFRPSPSSPPLLIGTNLDLSGVLNVLVHSLTSTPSPFPSSTPTKFPVQTASALLIGAGGASRAAVFALKEMNLSPIYLINRDGDETKGVINHFMEGDQKDQYDIRELRTVEEAEVELLKAKDQGIRLCVAVGAIPSYEPTIPAEKTVYSIARKMFEYKYVTGGASASEGDGEKWLKVPIKPVFLDMAYHPPMTLLRSLAEKEHWNTICGIECVLEVSFEQIYAWTGRVVPLEVREGARRLLREEVEKGH